MSRLLARLQELSPLLYARALEVQVAATAKLSRIVETFPHYTSHDASHKSCVLEICEWLAGPVLDQLNAAELFVLFGGIYLHDVGMALEPTERQVIEQSKDYLSFAAESALSELEALAEWVRRIHHKRSAHIVRTGSFESNGIPIRDLALAHAIALICESHGEYDLESFDKYDPFFAYGTAATTIRIPLLGVLLRLSDLLHLTCDRTPLPILPLINLTSSRSKVEWAKHLSTVGVAPASDRTIRMTCVCSDPDTHRHILRLCDYVNREFDYCKRVLSRLSAATKDDYELRGDRLVPNVSAIGYEAWLDLSFKIDREGIIRLVTGERIYHGPGAVVKELLMNAIDATRQARLIGDNSAAIRVSFDSSSYKLTVSDAGIGMDRNDLENFLLSLGRCIYRSEIYQQRYKSIQALEALSEFGIGFASCFLVSDHVTVETKRSNSDPFLLDLYDLLGFAAARRSTRQSAGTTVTLHIKGDLVQEIRRAVMGIRELCPHVEIPIVVDVDGSEETINIQSFCKTSVEQVIPFYRDKETGLEVKHRHFNPALEDIAGCISLMCSKTNDALIPGYRDYYKIDRATVRRVSQLGFALPEPTKWPDNLFGSLNLSSLQYDIDLRGAMRLELDPSRTTVLPSLANMGVIERLDDHLADFIYALHSEYWASLPRERRFSAYRTLGEMFFSRVMQSARLNSGKAARRLVDLLFENMPLATVTSGANVTDLTWNEIRESKKLVVFYDLFIWDENRDSNIQRIFDAIPDSVVVITNYSQSYTSHLLSCCDEKALYVSGESERLHEVAMPWLEDADGLHRRWWSPSSFGRPAYVVPFVPSSPYALINSTASRRSGGVFTWINADHPKIQVMIAAGRLIEAAGKVPIDLIRFLQFLHQFHGGTGDDPAFIAYIQQHQQVAIDELVFQKAVSATESSRLLLTADDFAPWDRPWTVENRVSRQSS